jgi:hypothetical protein
MNKKIKLGVSSAVAGISALAAAGALLLGAGPSEAATSPVAAQKTVAASNVPALKATQLKYVTARWNCNTVCHNLAQVPKGWTMTYLGKDEARFTGGSGHWSVRVDGYARPDQTTKAAVAAKVKSLKGTRGLKIESVTSSSLPWLPGANRRVYFTTVNYTYVDGARGTRWVSTRYMDEAFSGRSAHYEITVGGRVKDAGALKVVQNRATQTITQAN